MARQVLPIVGAVIGGYFGGPQGAQIGYALGSIVGNAIDPVVLQGPKIGDTAVQTSQEGAYRAIIYGTAMVSGNLIHTGPKIIKEEESQDKGGPVTVSERLFQTFAIRICEGPISGVLRIWEDEKLVYDVREGSRLVEDTTEFAEKFTFYLGGEDQLPDPDLEEFEGVGNVNAYRGSCYAVFPKYDLTDRGGRIPQYKWEIIAEGADITWSPKVVTRYKYFTGTLDGLDQHDHDGITQLSGGRKPLAISPDGQLFAAGATASPYLRVFLYDRDSEDFLSTPITGTLPDAQVTSVSFSPDGKWLVAGGFGTNKLMLYSIDGSTITFASSATGDDAPLDDVRFAQFSPNGQMVAISQDGTTPIFVYLLRTNSQTLQLINRSVILGVSTGVNLEWNPESSLIAYSDQNSIRIFNFDVNPMPVLVGDTSIDVGGANRGGFWSQDLNFFYLVDNAAPFLTVYRMNSDPDGYWLEQYPTPADQPPESPDGAALSYDRRTLVISHVAGVTVYRTNGIDALTLVGTFGSGAQGKVAVNEGPSIGSGTQVPGTLSEIVADIFDRCGMDTTKFDVSELVNPVAGYVLAQGFTGAGAINTLRTAYRFDASEYEKKIWFPKRGKPVVMTLGYDDLIDEVDDSTREDAKEYPAKMHLEYQNARTGYELAKATNSRSSVDVRRNVVGEASVAIPVVMESDEAQETVAILHKISWMDQEGEVPINIPDKYLRLVTADCIGLAIRNQVNRLRIEKIEYAEGSLKLTCRFDRQSAYTATVTPVPLPEPTDPPTNIVGQTELEILDIAALSDFDNVGFPRYYSAMSGVTPAWYGARLQRSLDYGASFVSVLDDTSGTVMGTLLEDVADADENFLDTTNTVQLSLVNSSKTLESITNSQFLSEGGAFALAKPDGTWELMQCRDWEQNSDGDWIGSTLLRGRLNSGTSEHLAGARFVLLSRVKSVDAVSGWIGTDLTHRAVSFGTSPESAEQQTLHYTGESQREWPLADIVLSLDGTTLNVELVPRHRFGTEDNPVKSVTHDGYSIVAFDNTGLFVSSFVSALPNFTIDVSTWVQPYTIEAAQRNTLTGTGPFISESYP